MALLIRKATKQDADALGRMGAALARLHHEFDPLRFMLPDDLEAGYSWWLSKELDNKKALVLVAELDGEVVGYAYSRLEGRDWNKLLDRYGELIDIWVDDSARRTGAGRQLVDATVKQLGALGAPRVVLMAAAKNETAQRLFASLGFRPTMVELTRETEPDEARTPSPARRPSR